MSFLQANYTALETENSDYPLTMATQRKRSKFLQSSAWSPGMLYPKGSKEAWVPRRKILSACDKTPAQMHTSFFSSTLGSEGDIFLQHKGVTHWAQDHWCKSEALTGVQIMLGSSFVLFNLFWK